MKKDSSYLTLYAVTDRSWTQEKPLIKQIEEALKGGATAIQLREKEMDEDDFLKEAFEVKALCNKYKVPFFINDNVEIAVKCGADGVHIGQNDMDVRQARKIIGDKMILGVSAQTIEQAVKASGDGADYLGVGAVFSTSTKKDADDVSLETLRNICKSVDIPVVAIGGIGKDNIMKLKDTFIAGVAVVSAIFAQKNIKKSTKELLQLSEKVSMPYFETCIFDLDGTLLDSMPYWHNLFPKYSEKLGIHTEENLNHIFFTKTLEESSLYIKEKFNLSQSTEEIRSIIISTINGFYENEIPMKDGVSELLEKLKRNGKKMIIATATDKECVKLALKRLNIESFFEGIITTKDVGKGKSNPKIFLKAAEILGTKPEVTLVFEDSLHAIKAAKKAHFLTAGVYDEESKNDQEEIKALSSIYILKF